MAPKPNMSPVYLLTLSILFASSSTYSQDKCYSHLAGDTPTIGNNLIERKFIWNKGNLITHSLVNRSSGQSWFNKTESPDFLIGKNEADASNAVYSSKEVPETTIQQAYLETTVSFSLGTLDVKRVFRVFKNSPAIACDTYLKGKVNGVLSEDAVRLADKKNIEFAEDMKSRQVIPILDQISLEGVHWQTKTVEFFDVTDWNNNLVFENRFIPYRKFT